MPKRRQILLLLAAGLLVFVLWALLARNREPSFQGRSLTQWLTICQMRWPDGVKPNQIEQAEQAVRHIGTNALPHYLKCIAYEPAPWQKSLSRLIDRLPDPLRGNHLAASLTYSGTSLEHASLASLGFELLGPQAVPAIPELTSLLHSTNSLGVRRQAAFALASIGKEGLPPLLEALANTNYPRRSTVAMAICSMHELGTNASPAVPVLIRCTRDTDSALAAMSIQALGRLHIDPEAVVPALTNAFRSADPEVRFRAVRSFVLWFGAEAYRAAPALRTMLADPDYRIGMDASNILAEVAREGHTNALAPEALTNAPGR